MYDVVHIGDKVTDIDSSPKLDGVSKAILKVSDTDYYEYGDDTGRTIELSNPFGSAFFARLVRARTRYPYQPYDASGALLDPAAEIGDAASFTTVYGGIYKRKTNFGRLMKADVSAPQDQEINHEFKYESPSERQFKRQTADLRASISINASEILLEASRREAADSEIRNDFNAELSVQATSINAKVSQTGGNTSSFGWSLLANEFGLYSNNKKVFSVNANGAVVEGTIRATAGLVGGWTINSAQIKKDAGDYSVQLNAPASPSSNSSAFLVSKTVGNSTEYPFIVFYDGRLKATQADITGKITSSSGSIGGWDINSSQLIKSVSNQYEIYLQAKDSPDDDTGAFVVKKWNTSRNTWDYNFIVYYNGKVVAKNAEIAGTITSSKGSIGGFTIGDNAIYNNISQFGGTQTSGVYLGKDGLQLGQNFKVTNTGAVTASNLAINGGSITIGNNFSVNSSGNVTANNMTLTGTLTVGGNQITAANLYAGAYQAYNNYGNWSDAYTSACTAGGYCYGGAGAGYSAYGTWGAAQDSGRGVGSIFANTFGAFGSLDVYQSANFHCYGNFYKNNTLLTLKTKTIDGVTINYLGW